MPYLKEGQFKAILFNDEEELFDINISEMLDIKEYNRPNDNFPFPHMDACFVTEERLFFNLYRTNLKQMVMSTFDVKTGKFD